MIKLKRILCPIDLYSDSDQPLAYAVALAQAYNARLVVCYCEKPPATTLPHLSGVTTSEIAYATSRGRAKELFEGSLMKFLGPMAYASFNWDALIIEGEDVGEAITQTASEQHIDLIVMRSRRRPHRAALLGSTAELVCRTAPCPVLVTHTDEREFLAEGGSTIALKRLLVAYDFSDYSELALRYAISLAQEHQAELHLLHVLPAGSVNEPELAWYPMGKDTGYHQAARRLQRAVSPEAHLWCKVKHAVAQGQPYREILSYAEKHSIDLISLGAHGAGFGMHTLFGSNVDRVLRQAPCPVLVARPLKPISPTRDVTLEADVVGLNPDDTSVLLSSAVISRASIFAGFNSSADDTQHTGTLKYLPDSPGV
jgi:nucleotide-binding universal stress UspA family protein